MKQGKDIWITPMTKGIRDMIHSYGSLKPLDSSLTDVTYFQDFAKRYNMKKPKKNQIMEQVKKIDVRNDQERKRDKVCEMYSILHNDNPDTPPSRLFEIIAREMNMTSQGVRLICIRKQLYTPPSASASTNEEKN